MYEEVAMKTGYKYPPMTPYEAKKILNLDRTNIDYEAKVILDVSTQSLRNSTTCI